MAITSHTVSTMVVTSAAPSSSPGFWQHNAESLKDKVRGIWSRVRSCFYQPSSSSLKTPLLQQPRSCSKKIKHIGSVLTRGFNNPYVLGSLSLLNTVNISLCALFLHYVIEDYAEECVDELNTLSSELRSCQEPYLKRIYLYEMSITASCIFFGFVLQRLWEIPEKMEQGVLTNAIQSPPNPSRLEANNLRIKKMVSHIQTFYSYEINLGTGFLYNGLWINTSTVNSWKFYYNAQAASIGIAGSFLGMYIRSKFLEVKKNLKAVNKNNSSFSIWKRNWKLIALGALNFTSLIALTYLSTTPLSSKNKTIIKDLNIMLMARPFGTIIADAINQKKEKYRGTWKGKILSSTSNLLSFQGALIAGGYYVYLNSPGLNASGLFVVGFAEGLKDGTYKPLPYQDNKNSEKNQAQTRCHQKILNVVKDYWKPIALIGFMISTAKLHYLDCYDVKTYDCPISFELSGNYVNVDGKGINIVIATGMANFYFRKILKVIADSNSGKTKDTIGYYEKLTNKYQFDLLSSIPYVFVKSGRYISDFKAYASYDPYVLLVLIGFTFGTYKHRANSTPKDYKTSIPTDLSVTSSLLV